MTRSRSVFKFAERVVHRERHWAGIAGNVDLGTVHFELGPFQHTLSEAVAYVEMSAVGSFQVGLTGLPGGFTPFAPGAHGGFAMALGEQPLGNPRREHHTGSVVAAESLGIDKGSIGLESIGHTEEPETFGMDIIGHRIKGGDAR